MRDESRLLGGAGFGIWASRTLALLYRDGNLCARDKARAVKLIAQWVFVVCSLVFFTVALGFVAYWTLIDTASPITSVSVDLLSDNGYPATAFKRGGLMVVDRENCSSRKTTVVISRELRRGDGFSYVLPSGPYVMDVGCRHTANGVEIPNYVIPGPYEYWVTMQYSNNLLTSGQLLLKVPELTVLP